MIIKKILSFAASIINLVILSIIFIFNSNAQENNIKYFKNDEGVLSIMYHRFNEFKYPSTNISMDVFKNHNKDEFEIYAFNYGPYYSSYFYSFSSMF